MTNSSSSRDQNGLPASVQAMLDSTKAHSEIKYRIRWRGNKSPIGAVIGSVPVAFARHDMLGDAQGATLGHYNRVYEFVGASRDEHEMVIFVSDEVSFPGALLIERLD